MPCSSSAGDEMKVCASVPCISTFRACHRAVLWPEELRLLAMAYILVSVTLKGCEPQASCRWFWVTSNTSRSFQAFTVQPFRCRASGDHESLEHLVVFCVVTVEPQSA